MSRRRRTRGRQVDDVEAFVAQVYAERDRIAPLVPDVDPGDLLLILRCLMQPFGSGRRFLLRELRPGVYVF